MLEALYIGISGALVAWMLVDFMEEDMIFGRYGKWIRSKDTWWSSPLGGCVYCFAVWVVIGMMVFYIFIPIVWQTLSAIAIGHTVISALDKIEL